MVYLVAHSMGGLAIRFALDLKTGGVPDLADRIGGVVTLDTPYRGSLWGDSFFAQAKSVVNEVGHGLFPSSDARAWHCLAGGPRLRFPRDCASPPALADQVPLYQVGGDVTVHRTLFGFNAYDIDLGGDGIVDTTSEWGSVGTDGRMVATQSGFTAAPCRVNPEDLGLDWAAGGVVGFWAALESDSSLIELYQGAYSADDWKVLGQIKSLLLLLFGSSCSHVHITTDPGALHTADVQLGTMMSRQAGLRTVRDLLNAPVPASCRHPAGRLHGLSRNWGTNSDGSDAGTSELVTELAVFGDVTGDGRSDAVIPLACNAGGVSWPQLLLVYGPGPRLAGWYDLADISSPMEHEDVDSLTLSGGGVDLAFRSYEGAGFAVTAYRGRLTARSNRVALSYDGPLTIGFDEGRDFPGASYDLGQGIIHSVEDTEVWLGPAPTDFRNFIAERWRQIDAANAGCVEVPTVMVDRYSHLGFASGSEGSCDGAQMVWYRGPQGWTELLGYQEGPFCDDLESNPTLKRALTVLGLSCWPNDGGPEQLLGSWPRSGQ